MRRGGSLRRTGGPERRQGLRPVSARRRRERERAWPAVKALVHMRDGWCCQRCGWLDPSGRTLDCHHRKLRSRGGSDEPENLVTLCGGPVAPGCHGWAHRNPAAAEAEGWLLPSWADREGDA